MDETSQLSALQKKIEELEASINANKASAQTPYVSPKPAFPAALKDKYKKILSETK